MKPIAGLLVSGALLALCFATSACTSPGSGESPADSTLQGVNAGGGAVGGAGAGTAAVGGGLLTNCPDVPACPAERPAQGAACSSVGQACEYASADCRQIASCLTGLVWRVTPDPCPAPAAPPPAPSPRCPSTYEAAKGLGNAFCTAERERCAYDEGSCDCTYTAEDIPVAKLSPTLLFRCEDNLLAKEPACEGKLPLIGQPCAKEGAICQEAMFCSPVRVCQCGVWQSAAESCPISRRSAKREIQPIGGAEEDRQAQALRSARLEGAPSRRQASAGAAHDPAASRLRPLVAYPSIQGTFAADRDAEAVDLYGLMSMMMAATRAQERRIERLEQDFTAARDVRPPASTDDSP